MAAEVIALLIAVLLPMATVAITVKVISPLHSNIPVLARFAFRRETRGIALESIRHSDPTTLLEAR